MKAVSFILYSKLISNDNFMILKNMNLSANVCYIH